MTTDELLAAAAADIRSAMAKMLDAGVDLEKRQRERLEALAQSLAAGRFSMGYERGKACLACGSGGPLTGHHVMPRRALRKLPAAVRPTHNVVTLCRPCHDAADARQSGVHKGATPRQWKAAFEKALAALRAALSAGGVPPGAR